MGAIGLNPIRLDRIGLDPIRINAIKLGVPRAASDRPYIDPEVLASLKAVCICYGKSNDDPDRAIVKNLVDPDNPFVISNAAFKLNSGFGKYEISLTDSITPARGAKVTDNSIEVVDDTFISSWIYYSKMESAEINSYSIEISGMPEGKLVQYWYNNKEGVASRFDIKEDGIYTLPQSYVPADTGSNKTIGLRVQGSQSQNFVGFKVRIIPSFEGAFVTDGIDDLITSTKTVQEMLGGSNEITVVSMIRQLSTPNINNYTNTIRCQSTSTGIYNKIAVSAIDKTGIYGYSFDGSLRTSIINNILGDKQDYSVSPSMQVENMSAKFLVQGWIHPEGSAIELSSVAWYWTIIANKVLTTDEINQVIAYYNLDRTLKPDILCNTIKQGITNENHAEFGDRLIDFSGNGRDIQLNNLAWDGDSGIGKYNYPNWKVTATIANTYSTIVNYPTVNGTYSINVNGVSELMQSIGLHLEIKYTTSTGIIYNDIKQDGVYSYILPDGATDLTLRFGGIPGIVNEPCNITITQIPSHAGALRLDGVNDFGKVTGMPVYKDYTIVVDYERISGIEQAWAEALISKSYIANQGAFVLMETNGTAKHSYSFGAYTTFNKDDSTRTLLYQSKYKCGDVDLNAGTGIDGDTLWLGTYRDNYSSFFNGAIYSLMSFPYSMSEFLIERQLKKYKLGTLYPDMVEFRPVIKANDNYKIFFTALLPITGSTWEKINIGDYIPVGRRVAIQISFDNEAKKLVSAVSSQLEKIEIVKNANNVGYTILGYITSKSPQKINLVISSYLTMLNNETLISNEILIKNE